MQRAPHSVLLPRGTLFAAGMSEDEAAQAPRPSSWEQDQQVRGQAWHGAWKGGGRSFPGGDPPPASRTERILDRGGGRHLCTSDPFSSGAREARAGERLSQHTWPAHLASALSASVSPVVAS